MAKAVDRRDPGAVELAGEIGTSRLDEPCSDARVQLAGRALCERHHEDRADVHPTLDGPEEPLDDDGRLACARAGRDEDRPACSDCDRLLGVRRLLFDDRSHARFTLQIGPRSHQEGQEPPFGSWRTSPSRMRLTDACARSTAVSTRAQNASSSR